MKNTNQLTFMKNMTRVMKDDDIIKGTTHFLSFAGASTETRDMGRVMSDVTVVRKPRQPAVGVGSILTPAQTATHRSPAIQTNLTTATA